MTSEEIIENNVLIARFVGFTQSYPNMKDCTVFRYTKSWPKFDQSLYTGTVTRSSAEGRFTSKDITQNLSDNDFEFHYNLGWLMPVIEVIETLQDNSFRVLIDYKTCTIYHIEDRTREYCSFTAETKVEATYLAVVEFVKMWKEVSLVLPVDEELYRWYLKPDIHNGDNTII